MYNNKYSRIIHIHIINTIIGRDRPRAAARDSISYYSSKRTSLQDYYFYYYYYYYYYYMTTTSSPWHSPGGPSVVI